MARITVMHFTPFLHSTKSFLYLVAIAIAGYIYPNTFNSEPFLSPKNINISFSSCIITDDVKCSEASLVSLMSGVDAKLSPLIA